MKIRDVPIIGRAKNPDNKSGMIMRPILTLVRCEQGPHRGEFALVAHGRDPDGRMTVLEIATYKRFDHARAVYEAVRTGIIEVNDVPNFEITKDYLNAVDDYYRAQRRIFN